MRATAVVVLFVAAGVVTACDRKESGQKAAAPAASGAETTPATLPRRKAGLWEQTVSVTNTGEPQTSRTCFDATVDEQLSWWGGQMTKKMCSENTVSRRADGAWAFTAACDLGSGGKTRTTGVATGDFDKHYVVKADSITEGASLEQMNGARTTEVVADYRGACPEGMKPGDMELPGGMRVNVLTALGVAK